MPLISATSQEYFILVYEVNKDLFTYLIVLIFITASLCLFSKPTYRQSATLLLWEDVRISFGDQQINMGTKNRAPQQSRKITKVGNSHYKERDIC
jgi:hypothetical protein